MIPVGTKLNARPRQAVTQIGGVLSGNCSADTNPDGWFPEVMGGGPSKAWKEKTKAELTRVLALCNSCPVKEKCLAIGMEPDNLLYGIWGGTLPDERIYKSGVDVPKYSYYWHALNTSSALRRCLE